MDDKIRKLIFQAIDEDISRDDFERLQDALDRDAEVRQEYVRTVSLCETLAELSSVASSVGPPEDADAPAASVNVLSQQPFSRAWDLRSPRLLGLAATILILVGGVAFLLGQRGSLWSFDSLATGVGPTQEFQVGESPELLIAGHATLRRSAGLRWSEDSRSYREGDILTDGVVQFDEGVAEIDFFCGATLIVEGPASLEVESDWSVRVLQGRLRANVPPAARGFVVRAAGSNIVDLGTEFALEVGKQSATVEVIDGEVELRGGEHDGKHLVTGESQHLSGAQADSGAFQSLSTVGDVQRLRDDARTQRLEQWQKHSQELRDDARLIAYYATAEPKTGRVVENLAVSGHAFDGLMVGPVARVAGRLGNAGAGLEFDRPGARVRTRIDGSFQAFTFSCWARIDALEHRYNSLFMGDGYENGEPHWQIREDGSLMFSIMVDDSQDIRHFNEIDQRVVQSAGLHHVYYSEPFWDNSKRGHWFHLAAVYDPIGRRVEQYVDGERVASEAIEDKFFIDRLKIGPAEIGNWGQPFRKTPWFAARNLNGSIDELAIFDDALDATEIRDLYDQGKPLGY